jgi:hypothetical protein
MVKNLIKKVGRKIITWLREDGNVKRESSEALPHEFSYKWLNHILFPQVLVDGHRAHYLWGVMQGMNLARALGIRRVSVAEFGVAGGNGLVALEKVVERLEPYFGVQVDIYGFDTGEGLPKPKDYRDLPNIYTPGRYVMDVPMLKKRLKKSQLKLGLVEDTIDDFIRSRPAPIAFFAIDLDFYGASMAALRLLDGPIDSLLPRIWCYFDDIMGPTKSEFTGERLAISDFNSTHEMRKISQIYGLPWALPKRFFDQVWLRKVYLTQIFDHKDYGQYDELSPMSDLSLKK